MTGRLTTTSLAVEPERVNGRGDRAVRGDQPPERLAPEPEGLLSEVFPVQPKQVKGSGVEIPAPGHQPRGGTRR